ncbi:MAG TPA: hypothetical protein VFY42_02855 [Gemmatimonadales bacterium]|nr:hypothetical protein [Gemmatimonadales bacterium]
MPPVRLPAHSRAPVVWARRVLRPLPAPKAGQVRQDRLVRSGTMVRPQRLRDERTGWPAAAAPRGAAERHQAPEVWRWVGAASQQALGRQRACSEPAPGEPALAAAAQLWPALDAEAVAEAGVAPAAVALLEAAPAEAPQSWPARPWEVVHRPVERRGLGDPSQPAAGRPPSLAERQRRRCRRRNAPARRRPAL